MSGFDPASLSVMVVDDTKLMRDVTLAYLRRYGIGHCSAYADGQEALEALANAERPVDLILLDLNMPVMDGIEVLRHLAARHFQGQVALISGENPRLLRTAETLARAHELNIIGVVEKPLTGAKMDAVLAHLKPGQRPAQPVSPLLPVSEDDLLEALRAGDIGIAVQPKISLRERSVVGVEALARWQHPSRGVIPPSDFVPIAETGSAAEPLFDAVLEQALAALVRWHKLGHRLQMAINISAADLTRLKLPDQVSAAVARHGLVAEDLLLEVTESRLIQDLAPALEVVTRLRLKGFGLSIDDFGTGYSSLEQLQRIPFDELKIDRRFVTGAAADPAARAIMASSIRLARSLGIGTVAEGIESQEDWDCALRLGCDVVQGYLIAPPMAADDFPAWLTAWK
ncbi:EAL domain-containing response regulator [Ferrovibrio sp. MS7]|uniref:EAL domain-containing response regulator n=1 Tax=Ferrovibrio plantarum TaxID=3119164 RepID=UPI001B4A3258|nr:EAL domain-containing response regulator [Ferrovibrio sp.]